MRGAKPVEVNSTFRMFLARGRVNLPDGPVTEPPLEVPTLSFRVMLTFCRGVWVSESITVPVMTLVCAVRSWAVRIKARNMVMRCIIRIDRTWMDGRLVFFRRGRGDVF